MPLARPVSSADVRALSSGALPAAPAPPGRGSAGGLGLKLAVERNAYVAGQQVKGVLELSVKGQLALGEVGIEFLGVEELRSRDHTSTRRLLANRVDFQGNGLPPSNAVQPGTKPIQSSFYPALPGRTRFAFAFTIPASMPSTCALGSNATTRYELRAFASSLVDGGVDFRSEKLDVRVVERWGDWRDNDWQTGVERKAAEKLALGGDGKLELVASVGKGEWVERPARLFWRSDVDMEVAGKGKMEVRAKVRNLSKRHVTGLKFSLVRRLRILYPEDARPLVEPPVVSSVVLTERFHGIDYDVRSGGERDVVLSMQVPNDECWTVRKGSLFELDVVLRVEVECGFLQKSLAVDLPVWIAHPLSLPNSAHRFADEERARLAPAPHPTTQPSIPYSPSTVGLSPSPYRALSPEPFVPAHDGQLPLPGTPAPGQYGQHYAATSISMTASISSPAMYPPPTPAPYFPPPPAAPSELHDPVPSAYQAPHGYVAFDPSVPDLTPSNFLGSLQYQQPGQVPPPPDSTFSSAQSAHFSPLPPHSPYAAPPRPHSAFPQHPARPPSRAHTVASELHLPPHEAAQVEANLAPVQPYSGLQRAHPHARTASDLPYLAQYGAQPVRQNSAPVAAPSGELSLPSASPPRPCASPVPSIRGHFSSSPAPAPPARSRVSHTPPPPSPSSHFRRERSPSPSLSPSPVESSFSQGLQPAASVLLETIGEDGESQAGGTARSAMLPAGMAEALQDDASGMSPGRSSVQDLEELVEEEERREEERKEREKAAKDKDLPPFPFPTSASMTTAPASRPRVQDIFSPSPASATPALLTSPQPLESPSRLPAPQREAGGLSALEARLARPSTPDLSALQLSSPSRSPSPIKPLGSPAPFPRTLAPHVAAGDSETVGSALRARSISRASRYAEEVRRAEEEDPREAVKRARERAEWAQSPIVRAVRAATEQQELDGVPTAPPPVKPAAEEQRIEVLPANEQVQVDERSEDSEAKRVRPATYKPLAPLNLAAPALPSETALDAPCSPSSPRRPLPSPPASPRRALPSPPIPGPSSDSTSPMNLITPAPPASPTKPVARPVFSSSPSKRDTSPAPPTEPAFVPPAPPRSPVKATSPNPWSRGPSPWSSVAKPPSPIKAASPAPPAAGDAPKSPIAAIVSDDGRKVINAAELKGLKRDAVDRVAGWLKEADAPRVAADAREAVAAPQVKPKRFTIEFGRRAPEPPASSSSATVSSRATASTAATSLSSSAPRAHAEPTVAQLLAAETRAAMRQAQAEAPGDLTRSSAVEKGLNGYLAALKNDAEVAKDEYAHRSAKRAQPGKVRSVASIWAERVDEADRERTASPPPAARGHKPTKSLSSIQLGSLATSASVPRPLAPVGNSPSAPRSRPVSMQAPSPSGARASPAKPFLNTTLGRPATSATPAAGGMRVPSAGKLVASESAPSGWIAGGGGGERGGARVKDLLARYTQQLA